MPVFPNPYGKSISKEKKENAMDCLNFFFHPFYCDGPILTFSRRFPLLCCVCLFLLPSPFYPSVFILSFLFIYRIVLSFLVSSFKFFSLFLCLLCLALSYHSSWQTAPRSLTLSSIPVSFPKPIRKCSNRCTSFCMASKHPWLVRVGKAVVTARCTWALVQCLSWCHSTCCPTTSRLALQSLKHKSHTHTNMKRHMHAAHIPSCTVMLLRYYAPHDHTLYHK